MCPGFSETHKKYIPVGLEGCGLRNLPWDAIYLGLQSKGCCQAPFRVAPGRWCLTGSFHIMFSYRLNFTVMKKHQPPYKPVGPQLRSLPKWFLNFTYFCGLS